MVPAVWVHCKNFFFCWSPENFNNLYELFYRRAPRVNWSSQNHFCYYTTGWPYINGICVLSRTKNQLWCPVISRAYIGNILLSPNKLFSWTKIAKFNQMRLRVHQYILWLYIPVTNALSMDVSKGTKQLVGVNFEKDIGKVRTDFPVITDYSVHILWNIFHYAV